MALVNSTLIVSPRKVTAVMFAIGSRRQALACRVVAVRGVEAQCFDAKNAMTPRASVIVSIVHNTARARRGVSAVAAALPLMQSCLCRDITSAP